MRNGISRIEVLVLILIAALAFALGIPYLLHSREDAKRIDCRDKLKRYGKALENVHKETGAFPPGTLGDPAFPPDRRWSWVFAVTPFLEQESLIVPLKLKQPSDDLANLPEMFEWRNRNGTTTTSRAWNPFACPSGFNDKDADGQILATYIGIAGLGEDAATLPKFSERAGVWGYERKTSIVDIADGTENTISIIETAHDRGSWYRGGPATVRGFKRDAPAPVGAGDAQFGGFHTGEASALFADGSVRSLSKQIDPEVFGALTTIAGEVVKAKTENGKRKTGE